MGRPPEVDHVKKSFLKDIESAKALVEKISQFSGGINPKQGYPGLHPKYVKQVVALAFMGVVASWEEFLERALVRYVAGARTKGGNAPTAKVGYATDLTHAYKILSRNPKFNPSEHYLNMRSDKNWVINWADFLFGDHYFTDIRRKSKPLELAYPIRDRVAHSSRKCVEEFKKTAREFLKQEKLKQGYNPGDLLDALVVNDEIFEQSDIQAEKTHFEAYADLYESLANKIVP